MEKWRKIEKKKSKNKGEGFGFGEVASPNLKLVWGLGGRSGHPSPKPQTSLGFGGEEGIVNPPPPPQQEVSLGFGFAPPPPPPPLTRPGSDSFVVIYCFSSFLVFFLGGLSLGGRLPLPKPKLIGGILSDAPRLVVLLHETLLGPTKAWEKTLKISSTTTSSKMIFSTKRSGTLSWEKTSKTSTEMPRASCSPRRHPSRNPLWGSWAPPWTSVIMFVASLCTRGVGQLSPRRPTRDGHILPTTTPNGVSPIIGPGTLPHWSPGWLSASPASPPEGRTDWLQLPRQEGQPWQGCC